MIKRCRLPCGRRMASLTILAEVVCDVIWVRSTIEVRAVALIAVREDQLVISVGMARLARRVYVGSRQWKLGRAVIERCRLPCRRGMARGAVLTEIPRDMIWISRAREVSTMALVAVGEDQLIISVGMTRLTRCGDVSTCQGKLGRAVIEYRRLPRSCRVTRCAILTEVPGDVVWICCAGKVSAVALVACRVNDLKIVVDVTSLTLNCGMRAYQRKLGRVVVERRRLPRHRCVAHVAVLRKAAGLMIGICRCSEICAMAVHAVCRERGELVVRVTLNAGYRPMSAGERELCIIVRES